MSTNLRLPENSGALVGYVATGVVTLAGLFFAYEMIADSDWYIRPQWNMFKSWLMGPLFVVGLIIAIARFGESHYSQDTIIETRYHDGTVKREKSYDISDVLLGQFLIPILGHFFLEPMLYAAMIYYPLMCVVALVGSVLPYVLSLLVLALCGGVYLFSSRLQFRGSSVVTAVLALLLCGGFGYGGWYIRNDAQPFIGDNTSIKSPAKETVKTTTEMEPATEKQAQAEVTKEQPATSTTQKPSPNFDDFEDAPAPSPTTQKPSPKVNFDDFE